MKLENAKIKPPKIILFGPYGSGKTCFSMTGGKHVQLLDMDEGVRSGFTLKDKFTSLRKEVDIIEIHESDPSKAMAFPKFKSYLESIAKQCREGTYKFKVLVIDSLTNAHEYCLRMILSYSGLMGQKPRIQDWMLRDIEFLNLCVLIKSLPIAVIVCAHQQVIEQDLTNVLTPWLPGKSLPSNMFSKFDEVLYIKPYLIAGGKTDFKIQNISTSSVCARTRSNFENNLSVDIGLIELLKLMGYDLEQ